MQNPFDQFDAPQAGPAPIIAGRPKQADPYRVEQDRINNANEAERLRMAQEAARIASEKAALDIEKAKRDAAAGPTADATEAERKNASFLARAMQAESDYLNIDADPNAPGQQQISGRSVPGQFFADKFPGIANSFSDQSRQLADQAQLAFIAAVLRSDSGAAIPEGEIATARRQYFPMPGDGPEVIAQKAQARRTAIEGLRESSGRMAPQSISTPEGLQQVGQWAAGVVAPQGVPTSSRPAPQSPTDGGSPFRGADPNTITFDIDTGTGAFGPNEGQLTPEQQSKLDAALRAYSGDPNFGPDRLRAIYENLGIPVGSLPDSPAFYDAVKSGKPFDTTPDPTAANAARKKWAEDQVRAEMRAMGMDTINSSPLSDNGFSAGFVDELTGIRDGITNVVTGKGGFVQGYRDGRDITRAAQDMARNEYGSAPEVISSLMMPVGALGRAETVGQFAKQGAAIGGITGFGQGQGTTNSLLSAGGGAALGGGAGVLASQAGRGVNALLQTQTGQRVTGALGNALARGRPNVDSELVAAGKRQGIKVRLPDAVESKRPAMAALEKTKTGAPRVAAAKAEDISATQDRLGNIVPDGGVARDETQLGKLLQGALERQNEASKGQTSAFFQRVEKMAPGARSDGAATLSHIDGEIARLKGAGARGNASAIKALEDMRADIAETGVSVESLQSLRASIRQRVRDNNLDPSASDRLFGGVDEAATKELESALSAANPKAVSAFRRANQSHAERLAFRREVSRELLGTPNNPLDAEKAATRLMSKIGSKGDEEGFGRVWASLNDSERADTAATIIHNLGGGDEFSLAKLATGLENANERTLRTVFGKEGYEALRDIRLIARRKTQTQKGLNNSNTGSIVEEKGNSLMDTILGVFGYTQGGPLGAAAAVGARATGEKIGNSWRARLLLNPDFTKWLRQTPNTTKPEVINRYFDRLNKIASREQTFLMDAQALQDYLRRAVSEPLARRSAAEEPDENRDREVR